MTSIPLRTRVGAAVVSAACWPFVVALDLITRVVDDAQEDINDPSEEDQ